MNGKANQSGSNPPPVPPRVLKPRNLSFPQARQSKGMLPCRPNLKIQQRELRHESLSSATKLKAKDNFASSDVFHPSLETKLASVEEVRYVSWIPVKHTGVCTSTKLKSSTLRDIQERRNATCFELDRSLRGLNEQKRLNLLFDSTKWMSENS